MLEFIRDSAWQFGGFILTGIGIIVTVIFFYKQKSIKNLSYILTNTALLRVSSEIKNRVKILLDDKPVENVHSILVKIINNGNASIKPEDVKVPINIFFDVPIKEVHKKPDVDPNFFEKYEAEEKERDKKSDELNAQRAILNEKIANKSITNEEATIERENLTAKLKENVEERNAVVLSLNANYDAWKKSTVPNKLSIIEANVTKSDPASIVNLEKNLITITDNRIEIKPIQLNGGDWFTVAITASHVAGPIEDEQVKVDARIDGIKEIKPYVAPENPSEKVFLITYGILALIIVIFGNNQTFIYNYLIALFISFILSLLVSAYFKRKRKRY